jgi:hypothetical protein
LVSQLLSIQIRTTILSSDRQFGYLRVSSQPNPPGFLLHSISTMQLWTVCFITLFLATQLYQTVKAVSLPMPVYIIAGALLAIASNVRRSQPTASPSATPTAPAAPASTVDPPPASASNPFLSQAHRPLPSAPIPPFSASAARTDVEQNEQPSS